MLISIMNKIFDCGKCAVMAVMLFVPVISMIFLQMLKINPIIFLLSLIL